MGTFSTGLQTVQELLGTKYVWGGNDNTGIDCSGFTKAVYAAMGIELPRVSNMQANAGQKIGREQAQPGDLVSWDLNGRNVGADHVGIYLGNGKVAEASSSSGKVVIRNLWGNAEFTRFEGINGRAPGGGTVTVNAGPQGGADQPQRPIGTTNPLGTQDSKGAFGTLGMDEDDQRMLETIYQYADDDDQGETPDTVGPYNVARLSATRETRDPDNERIVRPSAPILDRTPSIDPRRPTAGAARFG